MISEIIVAQFKKPTIDTVTNQEIIRNVKTIG